MPALPLAGPSYTLRSLKADAQRTVNWVPVQIESGVGKGGNVAYLKQIPGLTLLQTISGAIPPGGLNLASDGTLYAVAGGYLYSISTAWVATQIGPVGTGPVSMTSNATQLCIVADEGGWVYDFSTTVLTQISTNWLGSVGLGYLDGYGVYIEPEASVFYISANQDFGTIDALQYASIEGAPGAVLACLVKHREVLFLKAFTGEIWYDAGNADFPFARNDGAALEVGICAAATLCKLGGVAYWLGQDRNGSRMVFAMAGYAPTRISSHALEEALTGVADVTGAWAFAYEQEGLSYIVLQVPGLLTTWVYEVSSGLWHERAEWVSDAYQRWRPTCHAFAYGVHVVGDASGKIYELDVDANTLAGDVLIRDRITPHNATPDLKRRRFGSLQIDCEVGSGLPSSLKAQMLMRYSDDGAKTFGNWRRLSLGPIGEYLARARAVMLGAARDRVWHIRVTDDVRCNVLSAVLDEQ
jgi:hypothetical protein